MNTREAVASWCSIDTSSGNLTVVLEPNNCFDAEMYADELELEEPVEFREDQRSTYHLRPVGGRSNIACSKPWKVGSPISFCQPHRRGDQARRGAPAHTRTCGPKTDGTGNPHGDFHPPARRLVREPVAFKHAPSKRVVLSPNNAGVCYRRCDPRLATSPPNAGRTYTTQSPG